MEKLNEFEDLNFLEIELLQLISVHCAEDKDVISVGEVLTLLNQVLENCGENYDSNKKKVALKELMEKFLEHLFFYVLLK